MNTATVRELDMAKDHPDALRDYQMSLDLEN